MDRLCRVNIRVEFKIRVKGENIDFHHVKRACAMMVYDILYPYKVSDKIYTAMVHFVYTSATQAQQIQKTEKEIGLQAELKLTVPIGIFPSNPSLFGKNKEKTLSYTSYLEKQVYMTMYHYNTLIINITAEESYSALDIGWKSIIDIDDIAAKGQNTASKFLILPSRFSGHFDIGKTLEELKWSISSSQTIVLKQETQMEIWTKQTKNCKTKNRIKSITKPKGDTNHSPQVAPSAPSLYKGKPV